MFANGQSRKSSPRAHVFGFTRWRTWVHCGEPRLPVGSANDVHQLGNLLALIGLVAAGDRPFDAMIKSKPFSDAVVKLRNRGSTIMRPLLLQAV